MSLNHLAVLSHGIGYGAGARARSGWITSESGLTPGYVTLAAGPASTVDFQPTMPAQVTYDPELAAVVGFTSTPVADVRFEVVRVASVELELTPVVLVDFEVEN